MLDAFDSDPHTYCGAGQLALAFPMSASDIILLGLFKGDALLGDIGSGGSASDTRHAASSDEVRDAARLMSPQFRRLYEQMDE